MEGKLPHDIVYRKKQGFAVPLGRWLMKDLKPLSDELLNRSAIDASGFFNADMVLQLKDEHEQGARDNRKKLWTLMVFQMWYRQWMRAL
jgi:asparagine synthase (glutamine-hydrolysing)